jgi:hypothetical protein
MAGLLLERNDPVPCYTSILTGDMYFKELMDAENESRFRSAVRMDKVTFIRLVRLLSGPRGGMSSSRNISIGEKVMIFMNLLIGHSNRSIAERWQHSPSTISAVLHQVIDTLLKKEIADFLMVKCDPETVPLEISSNPKFSPFFDNCIGAVDGSHIPATVPEGEAKAFRNRKGYLSQNVLGVVNFDLTFQFALTGWEGSAHDGKVLRNGLVKGLRIPDGKFYLGDAGYALKSYCLTPYRGVRYHLKEFARGKDKPRNKEELFNLRHSSLRSAIERTFGIVKKRFPILKTMHTHAYSFPMQAKIVQCAFLIHNFIRVNQGYEDEYDVAAEEEIEERLNPGSVDVDDVDDNTAVSWRDDIASSMWLQYRRELLRRGHSL